MKRMKRQISLRTALADSQLLGDALGGDSWAKWRALLLAAMGEPLIIDSELVHFRQLTGREQPPPGRVEEFWGVIGRRGGKSMAIATLAAYLGGLCDYRRVLVRGEVGTVLVIAPDQRQAGIILGYAAGVLRGSPILAQLLKRQTAETIELTNGIVIEVRAASFRRLRGLTCVAAIADEAAFWLSEESSNPDVEILNAVRPTLATTGGPLVVISSPHARHGAVWDAFQRHYGPGGDPLVLVARGSSLELNPTLPRSVVDRAYERDAAMAAAEYGAEFRTDVESYVSLEVLEQCTDPEHERPFDNTLGYVGFVDPSGGSSDSFTLAIAHIEDNIAVLDVVRERTAPFMPSEVVEEFSDELKRYGINRVVGDRYAGEWPVEAFAKCGIFYEQSELTKSEIYGELLPLLNSRTAALLKGDRLQWQLLSLERRTARGGKDSIDHPRGGRDDMANAAAGALTLAQRDSGAAVSNRFNRPLEMPDYACA